MQLCRRCLIFPRAITNQNKRTLIILVGILTVLSLLAINFLRFDFVSGTLYFTFSRERSNNSSIEYLRKHFISPDNKPVNSSSNGSVSTEAYTRTIGPANALNKNLTNTPATATYNRVSINSAVITHNPSPLIASHLLSPKRFDTKVNVTALMDQSPPNYLSQSKNPCWLTNNGNLPMSCLPYFFIAGFPKSGTTDLFSRLVLHPDIVKGCGKEPQYLTRSGYTHSFQYYVDCYSGISKILSSLHSDPQHTDSQLITVDGSQSTLWDDRHWREISGNDASAREPNLTTTNIVRHILPDAKFVVMMRNPADRLYSDYNYFGQMSKLSQNPEHFHSLVLKVRSALDACTSNHTINWCFFDEDFLHSTCTFFSPKGSHRFTPLIGLYAVHLEKWMTLFPRQQFLFIRTEDYKRNIANELRRVFKFLNISTPDDDVMRMMENKAKVLQTHYVKMLPKTRAILDELYRPYNQKLVALINDERFLWRD